MKKKFQLGVLILPLSGAAIGCNTTSCYVSIDHNMIMIYNPTLTTSDTIVINNAKKDTISGAISGRSGDTFSYAVLDSSDRITTKVNILPLDGTFDESTEDPVVALLK